MILAMVFAHVWGVLELVALATLTRTVRVRTVLAALAVGLYACAPAAILLQVAWTRLVARLTGEQLFELVRVGSYTLDPLIEELVKVMPLVALIVIIPAVRRQWSVADCILIGAATGSGFGLAEDLFRYSGAVNRSMPVNGGWQLAVNLSLPIVPSPMKTLTSWLPSGAAIDDLPASYGHYNLHLMVSALGGLAIALMFLYRGHARRVGIALLLYIAGEHAAGNWTITGQSGLGSALAAPFNALRDILWVMPIAALAIAWWLDRQRQRGATAPELALARERRSTLRVFGVLNSAVARPPASIFWVDQLSRMRRAYGAASSSQPDAAERLRQADLPPKNSAKENWSSPVI